MRKGKNPNKDRENITSSFSHQVILPVHIPNHEDYFSDVFKIFQYCLDSLLRTTHLETFITVVDNGCCIEVRNYLNDLLVQKKIQELILTENVGKLNAIIKGLAGHNFPLITISDADVLFLNNWQNETIKVFDECPKAGVVGVISQFLNYQSHCENLIWDYLLNDKLKFISVEDPEAMAAFYNSIGWTEDFPKERLKYTLGFNTGKIKACVGSGHVVATYRRELFRKELPVYNPFKMGGRSEELLDILAINNGYYRLTTNGNYAYHMGNKYEPWMDEKSRKLKLTTVGESKGLLKTKVKKPNKIALWTKKKLVKFIFKRKKLRLQFLKYKGLPANSLRGF